MARRLTTLAISIQRFPYGETSQVVHFLTADQGRIGVLVRGAHRAKNSYQGPIDLLVRGTISVSLLQGRELGLLARREIETSYPELRRSLVRFRAARHLLGLLTATTPVGHGEGETFRLMDRALQALERLPEDRIPLMLLSYDLYTLRMLGVSPQLFACVRCGTERNSQRLLRGGGRRAVPWLSGRSA